MWYGVRIEKFVLFPHFLPKVSRFNILYYSRRCGMCKNERVHGDTKGL